MLQIHINNDNKRIQTPHLYHPQYLINELGVWDMIN